MANIRVTCPACKTELEVDAAFDGQEVECGNCLEVFTARGPSSSRPGKIPGAGPSSRGRREDDEGRPARSSGGSRRSRRRDDDDDDYDHDRREDDEDDYDYYSPPPRSRGSGANALAITALVLGILAIIPGCCCSYYTLPVSIAAVVTGAIGMRNEEGKGMAIAGLVLGAVSITLIVLQVALGFGFLLMNMK